MDLVVHRDTWKWLTALAVDHDHFHPADRLEPAVSAPRQVEDSRAREERRNQHLARAKAKGLIGRLRAKGVPAKERSGVLVELTPLVESAGDSSPNGTVGT
ncbi:hypothetical protein QC334_16600 [Streptomyces sp. DH18]|uniref:hypothetical protein n=1 Tax=unclassified Streptomyces TaxID=2593676 RepID=UPI001E339B3F|nr:MULTISPECIES: hypothetical protein [unclassified Streptomyces]MDG9684330.1 hypothetical protein [Streptomyces sp. DH18]